MRYSLHEIDTHHIVATTVAADRDEALDWFSEKLRLMLTLEGDPLDVEYPRRMGGQPAPCGAHFKPNYSGFRGQRINRAPSSIKRSRIWSDRCLSSDRMTSPPRTR